MNLRLLRTGTVSGLLLSCSGGAGAGLVALEAGGRLMTRAPASSGAWVAGGVIRNTG